MRRTSLSDGTTKKWSWDDAEHVALLTMRESYEGEMTEHNIEVWWWARTGSSGCCLPREVKDYLEEATNPTNPTNPATEPVVWI